ncbi:MAG TPA: hypothetical protein VMF69_22065 [Gemmataceae bacterium]|nr:hypothetical protein [Gemmataceae bacterium]
MPETKFRKGDRVRFRFVTRFVEGVVKEDRGPIGIKGRHLYLVEFLPESYAESPFHIELPAEDLQLVPKDAVSTE